MGVCGPWVGGLRRFLFGIFPATGSARPFVEGCFVWACCGSLRTYPVVYWEQRTNQPSHRCAASSTSSANLDNRLHIMRRVSCVCPRRDFCAHIRVHVKGRDSKLCSRATCGGKKPDNLFHHWYETCNWAICSSYLRGLGQQGPL